MFLRENLYTSQEGIVGEFMEVEFISELKLIQTVIQLLYLIAQLVRIFQNFLRATTPRDIVPSRPTPPQLWTYT